MIHRDGDKKNGDTPNVVMGVEKELKKERKGRTTARKKERTLRRKEGFFNSPKVEKE